MSHSGRAWGVRFQEQYFNDSCSGVNATVLFWLNSETVKTVSKTDVIRGGLTQLKLGENERGVEWASRDRLLNESQLVCA